MPSPLHGHWWTIAPSLWGRAIVRRPATRPWWCAVGHQREVTLTGRLEALPHHQTLAIIIHGLGGSIDSPYMHRCALACRCVDIASLRLSLRGADGRGDDIYHAGLVEDLERVLRHPSVTAFAHVIVIGYSLGGHVALHLAAVAKRLARPPAAVAAICSPLDLAQASAAFDAGPSWLYRRHVLDGLKAMYAAINGRGHGWVDPLELDAVDQIRRWDDLVVVPRFGFPDTDSYYAQMSAGPRLGEIAVPTLTVHSRRDPMVPWDTIGAWRTRSGDIRMVDVDAGGHCGFPRGVDLGLDVGRASQPTTIEDQVVRWCLAPT